MPVNYQELRAQISAMGAQWQQWTSARNDQVQAANALFERFSAFTPDLRNLAITELAAKPDLRCALPTPEPLNAAKSCPVFDSPLVVMAADGSQIIPSRHDRIEFGLLNIGAIRMPIKTGMPASEITRTELLLLEKLYTPAGRIQEDLLSLRRDMLERQLIADLTRDESLPVVALTDGPLEPYNRQKQDAEFDAALREYSASLEALTHSQTVLAGYVDRPGSDLVVRLLELAKREAGIGEQAQHPFNQVRDLDLFTSILQPGQRSALFELSSPVTRKMSGQLSFYFFYLCLGNAANKSMARIEIPGWVAENPALLDMLQSVLLHQASQLGGQPYPYVLHRAHEVALVTYEEKERIETMLVQELMKQGHQTRGKSAKSGYKSQVGTKTRYKR